MGTWVVINAGWYNVSTTNDPLARQEGLTMIDLNLALTPIGMGWKGTIFARNITGKRYKEYGVATALFPGAFTIWSSRGASVGLQLGYEF